MGEREKSPPPFLAIGQMIRRLREAKGITRGDLANRLKVDVSSLVGWEAGKRLPREVLRTKLAYALGSDVDGLFASPGTKHETTVAVSLIDTREQLPELLMECTRRTRRRLRALRIAAPYPTTAYVQTEWRSLVSQRLLDGTLEVQRAEVFYDLRRLQEALANIFRYNGCAYNVKSYCAGLTEVFPAIGGYIFDEDEFLAGAYWASVPPDKRLGLRLSGAPIRVFLNGYWAEVWQRGTWLNSRGSHDLSVVRTVALKMGLPPKKWNRFVTEARDLEIGDGAPPLI